jgi:hypothetical protein
MPDFLTSRRKEAILNSDMHEKLDFRPTHQYRERPATGAMDTRMLVARPKSVDQQPSITAPEPHHMLWLVDLGYNAEDLPS